MKQFVNPWTWQERLGYSQAVRTGQTVYLAGQGPISETGELVGEEDFDVQVRQTFANVGTVLEQAGASFGDIVRLTVYLTDIGRLRDYGRIRTEFLPGGPPPAGTAVEVSALAVPGMQIEVDVVAVV
jgi:reactive intermediate/imine deaminase